MFKNVSNLEASMEDIRKLTKYQTRLMNGGSKEQQKVYKFKVGEYAAKLDSKGISSDAVIQYVQAGGDPLEDIKNSSQRVRSTMDALEQRVGGLQPNAADLRSIADATSNAVHTLNTLKQQYAEYAVKSESIIGEMEGRMQNIKLPTGQGITQDAIDDIATTIRTGMTGDMTNAMEYAQIDVVLHSIKAEDRGQFDEIARNLGNLKRLTPVITANKQELERIKNLFVEKYTKHSPAQNVPDVVKAVLDSW